MCVCLLFFPYSSFIHLFVLDFFLLNSCPSLVFLHSLCYLHFFFFFLSSIPTICLFDTLLNNKNWIDFYEISYFYDIRKQAEYNVLDDTKAIWKVEVDLYTVKLMWAWETSAQVGLENHVTGLLGLNGAHKSQRFFQAQCCYVESQHSLQLSFKMAIMGNVVKFAICEHNWVI